MTGHHRRRWPSAATVVPAIGVVAVAVAVLVVTLDLPRDNPPAETAAPAAPPRIEITTITETGRGGGDRRLQVSGVLSGTDGAPETYIFVIAQPADGTPAGGPVATGPRLWYASRGTSLQNDGVWRTEIVVAEDESRPLTFYALAGFLCPASPSAPCLVDDASVARALATGTDTREWAARSPGFSYQPT
jgi:hypothetical protein